MSGVAVGTISLIAAMSRNRVIGRDGGMPWHLPEDLKYFKRTTMGHPMIMGRKTFDSMGALPGRRSIVVTRQADWSADGIETASSLDHALTLAGDQDVFVVGGAQIYEQALPFADRVLLTEIDRDVEGDTYFPELDQSVWRGAAREERDGFAWVTYERTPPRASYEIGERIGAGAVQRMGASAAVVRDGKLLLTRRSDNGLWCLPGGGVEPGERWSETAVREVREETGLEVRVTGLLGAYTDPDRIIVYPDGERVQIYGVNFRAEVVSGEAGPTDEVSEIGWFTREDASRIPVIPLHKNLLDAAFAPQDPPIWS